jgi:hypothetical protein
MEGAWLWTPKYQTYTVGGFNVSNLMGVRHSTAISYPSIENLFNGCQGYPLVCLPPGTAQRQLDWIKKGSSAQQFIQLTVVGDINAKSG